MKKLLLGICLVIVLITPAAAFEPGMYVGHVTSINELQPSCGGDFGTQYLEITFLGAGLVQFDIWVDIEGQLINIGTKQGQIIGNIMYYPVEDQLIDLAGPPFFLDALITNRLSPAVYVWTSGTKFVNAMLPQLNTCDGSQCDQAADIILAPGLSYPCMTPFLTMEYNKQSE